MSERPQNKYLKPFKPGQSGNPSGKPKGLITKASVQQLFQKFQVKTRAELQAVIDDPNSKMIEITIASILAKAAKEGDYSRMQFLLDRAVGKVKDEQELTVEDRSKALDQIPKEKLIKLVEGA